MTQSAPVVSEFSASKPHTSMNDDLSLHIPGISSHRNVYYHHSGSGTHPSTRKDPVKHLSLQRPGDTCHLESYKQATPYFFITFKKACREDGR
jgi:hypothetical protein